MKKRTTIEVEATITHHPDAELPWNLYQAVVSYPVPTFIGGYESMTVSGARTKGELIRKIKKRVRAKYADVKPEETVTIKVRV